MMADSIVIISVVKGAWKFGFAKSNSMEIIDILP